MIAQLEEADDEHIFGEDDHKLEEDDPDHKHDDDPDHKHDDDEDDDVDHKRKIAIDPGFSNLIYGLEALPKGKFKTYKLTRGL